MKQSSYVSRWKHVILITLVAVLLLPGSMFPAQNQALMRYPDIHGEMVVFISGGDVWRAPVSGGEAVRLTIHDGDEYYPKFSPDGQRIAFTGEYDGNTDVYVMNPHGGNITRVTYHPGSDVVVGWHPTENKILFRSARYSYSRFYKLFLISPEGTGLEELVLHEAVQGSFSPDASRIAYNKIAREHRNWKRYKGGMAQDIYLYNLESDEEHILTEFEGTDRIPMWIGNTIFFSSDRDGILNIYAYTLDTEELEQVTHHTAYDVRFPSMGDERIVYQLGAELWLLDTRSGETARIPVEIRADAAEARPYMTDVQEYVSSIDCSPSGERALVVARGEIFTVPGEHGPTRNLTGSSGVRDQYAVWSPDGKTIACLSDASGEYEIYLIDPRGKTDRVKLTQHDQGYRHTLRWSPDGEKIAFADQTLRLYYLDVNSREITEVDKANYENVDVSMELKPISDYSWSPDSRYIAYSKMDSNLMYQVYIYSLETEETHKVSLGLFSDFSPVFTTDGQHLIFASNRRFSPTLGDFEWEMVYKEVAGLYALTLREDGQPLFPLRSDEVSDSEDDDAPSPSAGDQVEIDFEGIRERIEAFPLPRGNYRLLAVNESNLYYLNKEAGDFNRFEFRPVGPMNLHAFSFSSREEETVIEGIDAYRLSWDGSQIVYKKGESVGIIESSARNSGGKALDLSDLSMHLHPREEWEQIFHEAWRMERDFYYEPNMHGVNWPAMREKYGSLLPYAASRSDVVYLIGEMIAELSTSHTYVWGGDAKRQAEDVNVGMLGVDWQIDTRNNRYQFKKIYREADWTDEVFPPLAKPGLQVQEGEYLLAVNGEEATADQNIYRYFQNLAGKQVELLVNDHPSTAGAREITVEPVSSESTLRYNAWMEHNRQIVEEASGGQIGYLHLPDTYMGSAREFPKYFYSQTRKQGLIIDGRYNGGGLDPDIFLRRLDKPLHGYWTRRYSHDQTIPEVVTRAHMVCLTNRQAGSGGDMLPYEFRKREMGPIIGTRTWGGLVGLSMYIPMIDGGTLAAPDYRIYDPRGNWVVENVGVEPDIVIDLHSAEMARGYDAQLMKAVEVLQQQIEKEPITWPEHEAYPVQE